MVQLFSSLIVFIALISADVAFAADPVPNEARAAALCVAGTARSRVHAYAHFWPARMRIRP